MFFYNGWVISIVRCETYKQPIFWGFTNDNEMPPIKSYNGVNFNFHEWDV